MTTASPLGPYLEGSARPSKRRFVPAVARSHPAVANGVRRNRVRRSMLGLSRSARSLTQAHGDALAVRQLRRQQRLAKADVGGQHLADSRTITRVGCLTTDRGGRASAHRCSCMAPLEQEGQACEGLAR